MQAAIEQVRRSSPDLVVGVVTATPEAEAAAKQLGFHSVRAWAEPWYLARALAEIRNFAPDAMAVLGADVLDGYYNPITAIRMLSLADLAARGGVRACVLGFSFNAKPSPLLRPWFDNLTHALTINVRDQVSADRLSEFSSVRTRLVADMAFMLSPDQSSKQVLSYAEWISAQRELGRTILGFNIHPMFIRDATPYRVRELIASASQALAAWLRADRRAVVLLAHDYRGQDSDDVCLKPLYEALGPLFGDRVLYSQSQMTAAELKGTAGLVDGVLAGRMHLAIAALGMGVPVAALTYQDKFQGLFGHFALPHDLLLDPTRGLLASSLEHLLEKFTSRLPVLRELVLSHLPSVHAASAQNLEGVIVG